MNSLKNKKIAVFGMGVSGLSALRLSKALEAQCIAINKGAPSQWANANVLEIVEKEACFSDDQFEALEKELKEVDFLILSPGIPRDHKLCQIVLNNKKEVIGEIEFAYRVVRDLGALSPIIAITGTNGKTTTTTFLGEAVLECDKKVFVGGNIGVPFCDYAFNVLKNIKNKVDVIVLELSSFQLESIFDFKANVALILNLSFSHGERYEKIEDYGDAKLKITNHFGKDDLLIISDQSDYVLAKTKNKEYKRKIISNEDPEFDDFDISTFKLPGVHNKVNLACAIEALKRLELKKSGIQKAIDKFEGVHYRIQRIKVPYKNLTVLNDAKSTNWDATLTAIKAASELPGPIYLILGGQKRGHGDSIKPYFLDIMSEVHFIYLIGEMGREIEKEFEELRYSTQGYAYVETLENVKEHFFSKHKGEKIVLLFSPAFPSFDQFKNYEDRGAQFTKLFT